MTEAEKRLWQALRAHRLNGFSFRRQTPVGPYIVDFICHEHRLIVEVDGGQHAERLVADSERTRVLESMGYLILRFWNNDVLSNIDGALELMAFTIQSEALDPPHPARLGAPTSPHRGEDG